MSFSSSFRAARWIRSFNLLLQALLFVSFFAGLNYLALHYNWRFDLTRLHRHSLSAETLSYLGKLKQDVRVVVTFAKRPDNPDLLQAKSDVAQLLREYVYATATNRTGRIQFDEIDVYQRPADARRLDLTPDSVLFLSADGERRRVVTLAELYRFKDKQREAFLGEQVFTAAILDVSSAKQQKIYFLVGHGEMELGSSAPSRGLSELRDALRARNYALDTLDLSRERRIPKDEDGDLPALLVIAGPLSRYDPFEQEILRRYMAEQAGRLMLFLGPGLPSTGLEDLLFDWGLVADNVLVFDRGPASQTDNGDLILNSYQPHPITQILLDNAQQLRFGETRTVRPNPSRIRDPGLSVARLVGTSPTAWGERDYLRDRRYTPGADLRPAANDGLGVVAMAERLSAKDNLPFSVPVGRMVAFGCADFIANERLSDRANALLFFSALNWLVASDTEVNVPARKIDKFQLTLSQQEQLSLRYSLLFGLPGAIALLGILVYWTRRR